MSKNDFTIIDSRATTADRLWVAAICSKDSEKPKNFAENSVCIERETMDAYYYVEETEEWLLMGGEE